MGEQEIKSFGEEVKDKKGKPDSEKLRCGWWVPATWGLLSVLLGS